MKVCKIAWATITPQTVQENFPPKNEKEEMIFCFLKPYGKLKAPCVL